jgi:plasmid stabilization system protein ParE
MLSPSLFTPQAWQDALEITEYIGTDNPEAASRFVPALEATCAQLVTLPNLGSVRMFQRKDLKGVRILPVTGFEHYLIFYSTLPKSIKVIRVLHAVRDFPTIFQSLGSDSSKLASAFAVVLWSLA